VRSGENRISFTGIDVLSLGLRAGDFIRVGMGAQKRMKMVLDAPTSATAVVVDTPFDFEASGLEFAIMSGDGYREEHHGDNNLNTFRGGIFRSNAGAAFAFNGLYGGTLQDAQIDYNTYGVRVGGTYGGNACIGGLVAHCYFEQLQSGKPFKLSSAQNWNILAPVDNNGDPDANIDYTSPGTALGLYVNRDGMFPIGAYLGFRSKMPSSVLYDAHSDFGFRFVPREMLIDYAPGYTWDPAGTTDVSGANVVELRLGGQHRTMTGTPSIGLKIGRLQIVGVHKDEAPHTLTLQDEAVLPGSRFRLRTKTARLTGGERILFHCDGSYWYEVGRWGATGTFFFDTARTSYLSAETANVGHESMAAIADGASAVAHAFDSATALSAPGAKLVSVRNGGVEKAAIDRGGALFTTNVRCTDKGNSAGAPGDATVNKGAGASALAASALACVVTNDKVAVDSVVMLSWEVDPGATWWVVPADGHFTVHVSAAPATSRGFRWFVVT